MSDRISYRTYKILKINNLEKGINKGDINLNNSSPVKFCKNMENKIES